MPQQTALPLRGQLSPHSSQVALALRNVTGCKRCSLPFSLSLLLFLRIQYFPLVANQPFTSTFHDEASCYALTLMIFLAIQQYLLLLWVQVHLGPVGH